MVSLIRLRRSPPNGAQPRTQVQAVADGEREVNLTGGEEESTANRPPGKDHFRALVVVGVYISFCASWPDAKKIVGKLGLAALSHVHVR